MTAAPFITGLAIVVLCVLASPARAGSPGIATCAGGFFAIEEPGLRATDGALIAGEVALVDTAVSLPGLCDDPTSVRIRGTRRRGTVVRATWATCGGFPGKVRLRATIDAEGCETMRGILRAAKTRPRKQRFTATRIPAAPAFTSPTVCAGCHPRQFREWQGSSMAYAAISPVMNALENAGNRLLDGAFGAGGSSALLCQGCHAPVSVALGEFPSFAESGGRPFRDFAGEVGIHGLSCDFCHQVAHADLEGSLRGDGIANAALVLRPGRTKFGPFSDPMPNPMHQAEPSSYLRSSEFCGSCHDVRIVGEDALSGEPFRRLEDAFSEWQRGPYASTANPLGRVVTCQDCHMSAYPYTPPGSYPTDHVAALPGAPLRQVSTHYFSGVDVALVDFPGQDDAGRDGHGLPIGQRYRREDLLRAACTLDLEVPGGVRAGGQLSVAVAVTNTGAGHNVPTGFSQERQMWLEVTVADATGSILYRSGHLVDRAHPETGEMVPDGRLDDEDLENLVGSLDPWTLEADVVPGPDRDQRPLRNLGLVNFGNEFLRLSAHGTGEAEQQVEEVFVPFLANAMDNTHSIPPLETARVIYDVEVPPDIEGPLTVAVRLRFRAFPPRFLRALARARPDLLDEALVDRNRIVDMTTAEKAVTVIPQP